MPAWRCGPQSDPDLIQAPLLALSSDWVCGHGPIPWPCTPSHGQLRTRSCQLSLEHGRVFSHGIMTDDWRLTVVVGPTEVWREGLCSGLGPGQGEGARLAAEVGVARPGVRGDGAAAAPTRTTGHPARWRLHPCHSRCRSERYVSQSHKRVSLHMPLLVLSPTSLSSVQKEISWHRRSHWFSHRASEWQNMG